MGNQKAVAEIKNRAADLGLEIAAGLIGPNGIRYHLNDIFQGFDWWRKSRK